MSDTTTQNFVVTYVINEKPVMDVLVIAARDAKEAEEMALKKWPNDASGKNWTDIWVTSPERESAIRLARMYRLTKEKI